MGWSSLGSELGEFVEVLPPQKRVGENWYLGTADAVYQNLYSHRAREAALRDRAVGRPHLQDGLREDARRAHRPRGQPHRRRHRGAARGVAALRGARGRRRQPGHRLQGEAGGRRAPRPGTPAYCLGSMGIYIFDFDFLVRELHRDAEQNTSHDFGKDIIPRLVTAGERVYAYLFWDENKKESKYWRDVGTLDAYYEASMDLISGGSRLQPLRPRVADAHLPAAAPPRQVRLRRGRAPGQRHRVHRVLGLHPLRDPWSSAPSSARGYGCTRTATSRTRS